MLLEYVLPDGQIAFTRQIIVIRSIYQIFKLLLEIYQIDRTSLQRIWNKFVQLYHSLLALKQNRYQKSRQKHSFQDQRHFLNYDQTYFYANSVLMVQYLKVNCMGNICKRCWQCCCCSCCACMVAMMIDTWHCAESLALSGLYVKGCCWTCCSPICLECQCGQPGPALDNCTKGVKHFLFSCSLGLATCVDACYNCAKTIKLACSKDGIKSYSDLTKNSEFMSNKVKESLGIQTGNEPLRSMDTFRP